MTLQDRIKHLAQLTCTKVSTQRTDEAKQAVIEAAMWRLVNEVREEKDVEYVGREHVCK